MATESCGQDTDERRGLCLLLILLLKVIRKRGEFFRQILYDCTIRKSIGKGAANMAKVGIVMGSDSDMPVMAKAADILEELGITYEMTIISAHREPDVFFEYAKTAEEKGFKVIIAGAGMAAHLPGMCAAIFPMPVIGIPMHTTSLGGRDSLYSIVQMPSGIPVATVAINGGANAGLLAARILATSDEALLTRLKAYSENMKEQVQKKDARLKEVGYKEYMKR
jgi:5-(carboxyamino)imidazole ribonucleotide mutase